MKNKKQTGGGSWGYLNLMGIMMVVAVVFGFVGSLTANAAGPATVNLGSAADFAILAETLISDATPASTAVTGDVGLSSGTGAGITGLSCTEMVGTSKIYDVDGAYTGGHDSNVACRMAGPGANKTLVDNAVGAMGAAYTDAATRTPGTGASNLNVGSGTLNGQTFVPGTYTWNGPTSNVTVTGDITIAGSATDIWIFQIAGTFDVANGKKILLSGGAQPSNIFWVVAGATTLFPSSVFEGNLLDQTSIAMQLGATMHGRALAQSAVTLIGNTVTKPVVSAGTATLYVEKTVVNGGTSTALPLNFNIYVKDNTGTNVSGSPAAGTGTPGTAYVLSDGTYTVSEDANALYTTVYGGDCNTSGVVTLAGVNKTCTIVNTDVSLPAPVVSTGGGSFAPLPLINITKIPNPLALPAGAGSVTYTYTLTNVGIVPTVGVWVKDNKCPNVKYVSGDSNSDSKLDINETWTYTCTKTVSATETNTVTAHGQANGWDGYDTAVATVVVGKSIIPPLIHVVTKPNVFVLPAGGGAVTYSYAVTNPGTAPLSNVSITDNKCTGLPGRVAGHPGDLNKNNLLESNETWSFTCQTKLTKTTTNIGTAIGYANGLNAVDLSPSTVVVGAPTLPNTGIGSDIGSGGGNFWQIIAGVLVGAGIVFVIMRKKTTV